MKTKTKITIDRLVGLPLAWLLNGLARLIAKILHRDHSVSPANVRTIVISKYLGMGSILQATPLIRSIHSAYPEARLIFVTGKSCRRMVERLEHIDDVITVDDSGVFQIVRTSLRTIVMLMRARVDLYFDLELYSAYSSVMSLFSLSRNRIGYYRESAQHKRGSYTHLMYFNTRNPIRHIYLQLGRLAGCTPVDPDRLGRIRIDAEDRDEVAAKLAALGVGTTTPYVVVNPNASDLLVERRWPTERFAELVDRLVASHEMPVILIGAPIDRTHVASVIEQIHSGRDRVLNLAGELSLGGLFALLEGAKCLITNDTGPMHMAWALGAPTVAMFGPVDPNHYGWNGSGVEILYKRIYCSPCVHEVDEPPCHGNNVCMRLIAVEDVEGAVARLLRAGSVVTGVEHQCGLEPSFYSDETSHPLGRIVRGGL
jgi:ADP-heptose:LPS heptosyltransferase